MNTRLFIKYLIILIIVILLVLLVIKFIKFNKYNSEIPLPTETPINYTSDLIKLDWNDLLINLNDCIKKYNVNLSSEYDKYKVLDILDDEYIKFKGITKENITEKIRFEFNYFNVREAYTRHFDANKWYVYLYGKLINKKDKTFKDYGYIIKLDRYNNCFKILPYDYMIYKGYDDLANIRKSELLDFNINLNLNNEYIRNHNDSEDIAKFYYGIYKNELLHDPEYAYSKIDKDYIKNNDFTFEKFKQSFNFKSNTFFKNGIKNKKENGTVVYKCKDSNNNIISFVVKDVLDYYVVIE